MIALSANPARAQMLLSVVSDASPFINTEQGFPPGNVNLPRDGGDGVDSQGDNSLRTANSGTQLRNAVFVFQLPNFGATANPFATVSFSATIAGSSGGDSGGSSFNFNPANNNYDLYGLGARASSTVLASDFYAGNAADTTDAVRISDNFPGVVFGSDANAAYAAGVTNTTGNSQVLLDYLNTQYNAGAGANQFVFLRINPDFNPSSFSNFSYFSGDSATNQPSLSFTTIVPEPSTWALATFGLAVAVIGRRRFLRA